MPCIFRQGCQKPCHIGRAARAGKPFRPHRQCMFMGLRFPGNTRQRFQRIHIEEFRAVQLHTRQNTVVQGALHLICIFAVSLQIQHLIGKKDQADGRTRLRISRIVGQVIILRERLSLIGGADRTRHVHPALRDIIPQGSARFRQCGIPRLHGRIRHTGIKIDRPYRMAYRLLLHPHRFGALVIFCVHRIAAPYRPAACALFLLIIIAVNTSYIDKVKRQLLVLLFLRAAEQTHERQLDLRMSGIPRRSLFDEMLVDMIRHAAHDLQKPCLAGALRVGNCRLDHMSRTVQFMRLVKIRPPLIRLLDGKIGIQIPVLMLCAADQLYDLIAALLQLRIRILRQRVGSSFQPFRHVAVLKYHTVEFTVAAACAQLLRRHAEILDAVAFLCSLDAVVQRVLLIRKHHILHQLPVSAEETVRYIKPFYQL